MVNFSSRWLYSLTADNDSLEEKYQCAYNTRALEIDRSVFTCLTFRANYNYTPRERKGHCRYSKGIVDFVDFVDFVGFVGFKC